MERVSAGSFANHRETKDKKKRTLHETFRSPQRDEYS